LVGWCVSRKFKQHDEHKSIQKEQVSLKKVYGCSFCSIQC